jgi:hypothetical protein
VLNILYRVRFQAGGLKFKYLNMRKEHEKSSINDFGDCWANRSGIRC